jgi:hypothetical protein
MMNMLFRGRVQMNIGLPQFGSVHTLLYTRQVQFVRYQITL